VVAPRKQWDGSLEIYYLLKNSFQLIVKFKDM
jgi:hypothetical protein